MAAASHRLRVAKFLLWVALFLMAVAQYLPWEIVPVMKETPRLASGFTKLSQVRHSWVFIYPRKTLFSWDDTYPGTNDLISRRVTEMVPDRIETNQASDLWTYSRYSIHNAGRAADFLTWGMMSAIIWLTAFASMLALPFLTGVLTRARPLLWLTRFFACSMFIWVVRNLILALKREPGAWLIHTGSGQWLSMASLALVIAALFLLPDPRPPQLRQIP